MNNILGGLFSSRINLNLREDKGYTYGAFSAFVFRRSAGPFVAGAGVRTDVTAPSVTEIFKEIRKMAESPVSADELNFSKESLTRSLPGDFETSTAASSIFSNLFVYGLGLDYYAKYPAQVTSVTIEQAQAAAQKYLVSEKMVVIAVGDKAQIEPELAKLNLGALEICNADGEVIQ